jgi:hypothetical protein
VSSAACSYFAQRSLNRHFTAKANHHCRQNGLFSSRPLTSIQRPREKSFDALPRRHCPALVDAQSENAPTKLDIARLSVLGLANICMNVKAEEKLYIRNLLSVFSDVLSWNSDLSRESSDVAIEAKCFVCMAISAVCAYVSPTQILIEIGMICALLESIKSPIPGEPPTNTNFPDRTCLHVKQPLRDVLHCNVEENQRRQDHQIRDDCQQYIEFLLRRLQCRRHRKVLRN